MAHELAETIARLMWPVGEGHKKERYKLKDLATRVIRNWLGEKAREIFTQCHFNSGQEVRQILGLDHYPDSGKEVDRISEANKTMEKETMEAKKGCDHRAGIAWLDEWKFCPICGAKRPNEARMSLDEVLYLAWIKIPISESSAGTFKKIAHAAIDEVLKVVDEMECNDFICEDTKRQFLKRSDLIARLKAMVSE